MGKAMLRVAVVMAALLALSTAATADLTLNYEGSMKLPRVPIKDYYARGVAYLPDGHVRPGWGGAPVTGPTLLVHYDWGHQSFEYGSLPALSTTAAQLAAAPTPSQVSTAIGGTYYKGSKLLRNVDAAGNIWDCVPGSTSGGGTPMWSDPGAHVLGAGSLSGGYAVKESGWPSSFSNSGAMRLGDGAGGDLPSNGNLDGATFVMCRKSTSSPDYPVYVYSSVRSGDGGNMVSTELYHFNAGYWPANFQVDYVRDTSGAEYYMMWLYGGHAGDSFVIDFYDSSTSGAGATPTYQLDIGPAIAGGAGWLAAGSNVAGFSMHWPTNELYVVENNGMDGRIHVFTLQGPVAKPVPEPVGLGLVGMALLALKRRRS